MKLTKETIKILENFSDINGNIFIRSGNVLRTVCPETAILASAEVSETFPRDFAIYELKKLIRGIVLHKNPTLNFDENESYVSIEDSNQKLKYYYCDTQFVQNAYEIQIECEETPIQFKIHQAQLEGLLRITSMYSLQNLSFSGDSENLRIVSKNRENPTSPEFSIEVGKTDREFEAYILPENLKIIPTSYDVSLYESSKIIKFYSQAYKLTYYIAMESN